MKVNIAMGNTPESAVVHEIASRQYDVFKQALIDVSFSRNSIGKVVNIIHKYGVAPGSKSDIFYFHFDPYDIRHGYSLQEISEYLSDFKCVVCLNRKQIYFCNKRNINCLFIPQGSDFAPQSLIYNKKRKPVIALCCNYYRGNVKGDLYFSYLSKYCSHFVDFLIVGRGWNKCEEIRCGVRVQPVSNYEELKSIFSDIDILFIGSRYEAGPASFPDAVNSGKFVLSSPVGMVIDNFKEGESGYFLTFDRDRDIRSLNMICEKISQGIRPKFSFYYNQWEEQLSSLLVSL